MKERSIAIIALFAAIIAALGLIPKFDLPFGVPITAQSLGVMLCGVILGARKGALAVLLFLSLVALGLPLLAGGRGGISTIIGPTGGFILGFVVAAFASGLIMQSLKGKNIGISAFVAAILGGIIVLYPCGILWLCISLDKSFVEMTKPMLVFIPGDLIKAAITAFIAKAIYEARPTYLYSWQ